MMTPDEAVATFKEGFHCPDVALTETLAVIQRDAQKHAYEQAIEMCDEVKRQEINKQGCSQGALLCKHGIIALLEQL